MNKQDILATAQAEGITLSPSTLNRYIQYGLLPSKRHSSGYKSGVKTHYPDARVNLRFIHQTCQKMLFPRQQDLLPYLYWHGYNVRTKDLQLYMLNFQEKVQSAFQKLRDDYQDEFDIDWFLRWLEEDPDLRSVRPPGRPSSEEKEKRAAEQQETRIFCQSLLRWIQQIAVGDRLSAFDVMETFIPSSVRETSDLSMTRFFSQNFIQGFHWLKPEESIDWSQISTMLRRDRETIDLLIATQFLKGMTTIPERLHGHPGVISLTLLLVMTSHQAPLLHQLLTMPQFQDAMESIIQTMKGETVHASDSTRD
ncbi:hypothetical protein [Paenibacillus campi]|uniref:hypothetical protein n=1 Tax=Paenibacillus campi TaxID=3106031 RepID=UPI002AFDCA67|nr:hypothetical protein [Paenibacillus sp. SGZ-1014]